MTPLHYDALMTIAKTYTDLKQPLLAIAALQQGLIVTDNKTKRRGNIYYDMGKIWGVGERHIVGFGGLFGRNLFG